MINVLAAPTEVILSPGHYARSYRLLSESNSDEVEITAIVNRIEADIGAFPNNVSVHALNKQNRLSYFASLYRNLYQTLRSDEFDVYQHANLGFREFNPSMLLPPDPEIPFLIGPAESGHAIPTGEFKRVFTRQVDRDIPDPIVDIATRIAEPVVRELVNPPREWLFGETLEYADRVVAVHSDAKHKFEQHTDGEKIEVIPYGVDLENFAYRETKTGPDLLTIGNLIRRKGHRYLLRAMPKILAEIPDAHLHIVGTGRVESDLLDLAAALGIEKSITFHGYVTNGELLSHLYDARAFVHPSISEGFSHVRLEAMATGTPVVGTNVDGAYDLTRDGTDGFVVPRRNPDALAEAALKLLTDEERAREMGRNAREKIERDHDYADIGERYLEIYRELAGETD